MSSGARPLLDRGLEVGARAGCKRLFPCRVVVEVYLLEEMPTENPILRVLMTLGGRRDCSREMAA